MILKKDDFTEERGRYKYIGNSGVTINEISSDIYELKEEIFFKEVTFDGDINFKFEGISIQFMNCNFENIVRLEGNNNAIFIVNLNGDINVNEPKSRLNLTYGLQVKEKSDNPVDIVLDQDITVKSLIICFGFVNSFSIANALPDNLELTSVQKGRVSGINLNVDLIELNSIKINHLEFSDIKFLNKALIK